LQDINKCCKKSKKKKYYDELISTSKNVTKTTWRIIRKEIGNNNCQNDIKPLKTNNSITINSQETANTFSDHFLTYADIVTSNIKKGSKDPSDNDNPSNCLINKLTAHFQE